MTAAESAPSSLGPRFAPEDPTLPKPWTGLIDGTTGLLYYWNPETNVTQYERPAVPIAAPPLPPGPPPSGSTPKLAPIPIARNLPPNGTVEQQPGQQMLQQLSQPVPQQPQQPPPSQQLPFQQMPLQRAQQVTYPQTHMQNQQPTQFSQQLQQMQYPQASYLQGQVQPHLQVSHQQGKQLQGLPVLNQQGQQPQGLQISQQQGQQSQGSQIPHQQGQQPLGLQLGRQQGQQPQGPQITNVQGPQPNGQQLGYYQGQKVGIPRAEQSGIQDGKEAGITSPPVHHTGMTSSNVHLPGGSQLLQPQQQFGRPSPVSTQQTDYPLVQLQREGIDTFHHQQRMGGSLAPSQTERATVYPPTGLKMNYEEDQHRRTGDEFYFSHGNDGSMIPRQQPKLVPPPVARNQLDARMGAIDSQFSPQGHIGEFNMVPSRGMPNIYNNAPFPHSGTMRPPLGMFGSPEFPDMSAADAYRQHHEVTAMGENVPAPFMTFESTGFPPEILREMHLAGFSTPTPIQAQTWPVALQNRDIVAIAKTGSGKTLGFLIPAFVHLRRCHNNPQNGPTVLILAPTRELATQIQEEALKFGRSSRISCTCLYGGAPKVPQLKELERGSDIVVATPGRLNDILEMRKISFCQVSLLVLDEADRMLDMGFEPQIRRIVNEIPPRRQTLMYTATWPKEVRKIAGDLLVNPVQVNIGSVDELAANKSITQYVEVVPQMDKQRRLEQILRDQERGSKIIIFCSTKRLCDQLARSIGRTFGAAAIHGDKSQDERDRVLNEFRSGRSAILVATDVAARGLDIKDIRVVINYDFPTGIEDYVHRIGRTGRAGATGVSYTFFSDQDWKYAADLVKVLEGANQHVPVEVREMAARGGPIHPRGGEHGGIGRFDSGGGRWDAGGGRGMMRDGTGGRGMMRDGGGGRGMMRDGGGGRGAMRDGPGGNFGGRGGGRNDFYSGRGGRGRGFGRSAGPGGRGRQDWGMHDRYNHLDGRSHFDNRRVSDRGRDSSYSRSPERARTLSYDRSRSQSRGRSRSRSRSWSRSRSRSRSWSRSSRSRSRSRSYDQYARSRVRVSGFDVPPPSVPVQEAPPPSTSAMNTLSLSAPALGSGYEVGTVPSFDAGQMSPMSPGQDHGSFPTGNMIPEKLPSPGRLPVPGTDFGQHPSDGV